MLSDYHKYFVVLHSALPQNLIWHKPIVYSGNHYWDHRSCGILCTFTCLMGAKILLFQGMLFNVKVISEGTCFWSTWALTLQLQITPEMSDQFPKVIISMFYTISCHIVLYYIGSFYQQGLFLILEWRCNHIPCLMWDGITYPFTHFNSATFTIWESILNSVPPFTGHVITYTCRDLI